MICIVPDSNVMGECNDTDTLGRTMSAVVDNTVCNDHNDPKDRDGNDHGGDIARGEQGGVGGQEEARTTMIAAAKVIYTSWLTRPCECSSYFTYASLPTVN